MEASPGQTAYIYVIYNKIYMSQLNGYRYKTLCNVDPSFKESKQRLIEFTEVVSKTTRYKITAPIRKIHTQYE